MIEENKMNYHASKNSFDILGDSDQDESDNEVESKVEPSVDCKANLGRTRSETQKMKYMKPVTRSESTKMSSLGFVLIGQAPQEPTTFGQAWDHPSSFE